MTTQLPNKLSQLLRLAVADAQKCEAMPEKYRLDMAVWHLPDEESGKCAVCMAGSVLAQTLRADPGTLVGIRDTGYENESKLAAINLMRAGSFYSAYLELNDGDEPSANQEPILETAGDLVLSNYKPDHAPEDGEDATELFGRAGWDTYLKAAAVLEEAGL